MTNLSDILHILATAIGLVLLFLGIQVKRKNFILAALWLSLIALFIHYRISGGEILGSYFNYFNAAIYSLNLFALIISSLYLLFTPTPQLDGTLVRYGTTFISAVLIVGTLLLFTNLWVNAIFIENRLPGTPILQVATFSKQPYCNYKYIFYKISADNQVKFMCPNHYGLLPSVGRLDAAPDFVIRQLPPQLQARFQKNLELSP